MKPFSNKAHLIFFFSHEMMYPLCEGIPPIRRPLSPKPLNVMSTICEEFPTCVRKQSSESGKKIIAPSKGEPYQLIKECPLRPLDEQMVARERDSEHKQVLAAMIKC